MKDLKAIRGYKYIAGLVALGEHEGQDFKLTVNDARKIARTVSAFANNSGGHLLIGVKDNGAIAGIRSEEDIFVVEQAAQCYCEPPQPVGFAAYRAGDADSERPGARPAVVVRAYIAPSGTRPVAVREADGCRRAYYRVADENIAAHPLMVRAWRREADKDGCRIYSVGDAGIHGAIIEAVESGADTPTAVARAIHTSQRSVDDAIVDLLVAGALRFAYDGAAWRLHTL